MGLLDGIIGKGNGGMVPYEKLLTEADFTKTDHQTLPSTTEWTTIATYKCPAQQKISVGYGTRSLPDSAGRIYVFMRTGEATPVEITGKIRVIVTNYNATKQFVLFEDEGAHLHGSLTDINQKRILQECRPMIGEDSYIKVQMLPTAAHVGSGAGADNIGWASATESLLRLPV